MRTRLLVAAIAAGNACSNSPSTLSKPDEPLPIGSANATVPPAADWDAATIVVLDGQGRSWGEATSFRIRRRADGWQVLIDMGDELNKIHVELEYGPELKLRRGTEENRSGNNVGRATIESEPDGHLRVRNVFFSGEARDQRSKIPADWYFPYNSVAPWFAVCLHTPSESLRRGVFSQSVIEIGPARPLDVSVPGRRVTLRSARYANDPIVRVIACEGDKLAGVAHALFDAVFTAVRDGDEALAGALRAVPELEAQKVRP